MNIRKTVIIILTLILPLILISCDSIIGEYGLVEVLEDAEREQLISTYKNLFENNNNNNNNVISINDSEYLYFEVKISGNYETSNSIEENDLLSFYYTKNINQDNFYYKNNKYRYINEFNTLKLNRQDKIHINKNIYHLYSEDISNNQIIKETGIATFDNEFNPEDLLEIASNKLYSEHLTITELIFIKSLSGADLSKLFKIYRNSDEENTYVYKFHLTTNIYNELRDQEVEREVEFFEILVDFEMELVNNKVRSYKQNIIFDTDGVSKDNGVSKFSLIIGSKDLFKDSNYEGYIEAVDRNFYQLIIN